MNADNTLFIWRDGSPHTEPDPIPSWVVLPPGNPYPSPNAGKSSLDGCPDPGAALDEATHNIDANILIGFGGADQTAQFPAPPTDAAMNAYDAVLVSANVNRLKHNRKLGNTQYWKEPVYQGYSSKELGWTGIPATIWGQPPASSKLVQG